MHNSSVSFCIYMHTNIITGKQYIGLTSKGIEKRWKSHIAFAKKHNKYYFHRAINKYGIDSHGNMRFFKMNLLKKMLEYQL